MDQRQRDLVGAKAVDPARPSVVHRFLSQPGCVSRPRLHRLEGKPMKAAEVGKWILATGFFVLFFLITFGIQF
jgi:hypothetical protein